MRDDNISNNNSQNTIRGTNIANDHGDADDADEDSFTSNGAIGGDENKVMTMITSVITTLMKTAVMAEKKKKKTADNCDDDSGL